MSTCWEAQLTLQTHQPQRLQALQIHPPKVTHPALPRRGLQQSAYSAASPTKVLSAAARAASCRKSPNATAATPCPPVNHPKAMMMILKAAMIWALIIPTSKLRQTARIVITSQKRWSFGNLWKIWSGMISDIIRYIECLLAEGCCRSRQMPAMPAILGLFITLRSRN